MAFDVFLSHNSKDKPAVRELAQALDRNGIRVWLDEDQLIPGRPWQKLLEAGIEQSATGAVLVGRDGLGPWEDEEMQALLRHAAAKGKPVIPVLLPGAPAEPGLPLFLANRKWVDLRDGFTDRGIAALVWGITGERDKARPGDAEGAAAPHRAPGRITGPRGRLAMIGVVALVLAALAVYFLGQAGDRTATTASNEAVFAIWTITEADDKLTPERRDLRRAEVETHRAPGAFIRLLEARTAAAARLRIFRLHDGAEITARQGDPLAGDNDGVLVVPESLVAPFGDAHDAFTFLRSQLPKD